MHYMRVAIYIRVSTEDQTAENQLPDCLKYIDAYGHQLVEVYKDTLTGTTTSRPGLQAMLDAGKRRHHDSVLIWRLDRLSRSVKDMLQLIAELQSQHIRLISVRDSLDLDSAAGKLLLHVLASVAQWESDVCRERTLAGLASARAKGKHIGRPCKHAHVREIIEAERKKSSESANQREGVAFCDSIIEPVSERHQNGYGGYRPNAREISKLAGCSISTARRVILSLSAD